jgi:hypothetical protein
MKSKIRFRLRVLCGTITSQIKFLSLIDPIRNFAYACQACILCDPDVEHVFQALRKAGVKLMFSPTLIPVNDHFYMP